VSIDRDELDSTIAGLGVRLDLLIPGTGHTRVPISFEELDDFLPDRLFERVPLFETLRLMRTKLSDPRTFSSVASPPPPIDPVAPPAETSSETSDLDEETEGFLDRILAQTGVVQSRGEDETWHGLLSAAIRPNLVPRPDPRQGELLTALDNAVGSLMALILHNPAMAELEAAWRSVRMLVYRLETGRKLKLYLLDITRDELAAAVRPDSSSPLESILVGEPWGAIATTFCFDAEAGDIEMLGQLADAGSRLGTPFIASITPTILNAPTPLPSDPDDWNISLDRETADAWNELRAGANARYLGLILPRMLMRPPYGRDSVPAEGFEFEEIGDGDGHGSYLWGNPAFTVLLILGETFSASGWDMDLATHKEVENLPVHQHRVGRETVTLGPTETVMTERAATRILAAGIIPLIAFRDGTSVRLPGLQSVANPPAKLAARWS
jgi:type VI secretion system protein ImpC